MNKGKIRDTQLASLIADELDYLLGSANDPRLTELKVTGVMPKAGAGHFTVYVVPYSGNAGFSSAREMQAALKKAAGFLRYELAGLLNLKRTPDLTLIPDPLHSYSWGTIPKEDQ